MTRERGRHVRCSALGHGGGQCSAAAHVGYQRRRPERSVLHQIVSQHVQTLWAEAEAASGFGYPS